MDPKKITMALVAACVLTGCTIPDARIKKTMWKHCAGDHWSDVLSFENPEIRISRDTIYNGETALYYIVKREHRLLANDDVLVLQNMETSQVGVFCGK